VETLHAGLWCDVVWGVALQHSACVLLGVLQQQLLADVNVAAS
jgi:hypothetical protein